MTPSQAKERAREIYLGKPGEASMDALGKLGSIDRLIQALLSIDKSARAEQREKDAKVADEWGGNPGIEIASRIRSQHEQGER